MKLSFTKTTLLAMALTTAAFAAADGHILARGFYGGSTVLIHTQTDGTVISTKKLKKLPAGGERFAVGQLPGFIVGGADVAVQIGNTFVDLYRYDANGNRVADRHLAVYGRVVGMGDLNRNSRNELIIQKDSGALIGYEFDRNLNNKAQVYNFPLLGAEVGQYTQIGGVYDNQVLLQKPGFEYKLKLATFKADGIQAVTNIYDPTTDMVHYPTNPFVWDPIYDSIGGFINQGGDGQRQVFINHRAGRVQVEWSFDTTMTTFFRTAADNVETPLPNKNYKVLASGN
ncbi:hypothetical protein BH11ARM1_BH11ARM1_05840 [soil metagenome]